MALICLDSHVLIWGIKEHSQPDQQDMIARAKNYLEHLDDNGDRVLLPAIVVAEFMMRIPEEHHATFVNLMRKSFFPAPFDTAAAMAFSKVWRSKKSTDEVQALIDDPAVRREELKADCMIVATAIAHKADAIITHDKKLAVFADGFIKCSEIPEIARQMDLLEGT